MNLYAYVRNDPTNSADPTGSICVGNAPKTICLADNASEDSKVPPTQRDPAAEEFGKSTISNLKSEVEKTAVIFRNEDGSFRQEIGTGETQELARGWATPTLAGKGYVTQHSHPETDGSIAPGYLDKKRNDASVLLKEGISQIYNRERIGTLTVNNRGMVVYVIEGRMGRSELRETQRVINRMQKLLEKSF